MHRPWVQAEGNPLAGSEWELVSIQSMDDAQGTLRIADPAAFTLQLGVDGRAALKLDCNRGSASWQATPAAGGGSGQFAFGPLANTRTLCPSPHLGERIVRDLDYVRGHLLRDGNLYLSLMADGVSTNGARAQPPRRCTATRRIRLPTVFSGRRTYPRRPRKLPLFWRYA